jgi:outer membrane protein TolC
MNRRALAIAGILVFAATGRTASLFDTQWISRRFHPETAEVRPIEGLAGRVQNGRLTLDVQRFLELFLKNSTDVNVSRLDVYTAGDQITAAFAPFDPAVSFGYSTLRTVNPEYSQISGASTLSSLNQNANITYQQFLPTGTVVESSYTGTRASNNSAFNLFNPSVYGTLNFVVSQPLWQNRTGIVQRAPLKIARTQLLITSRQTEAHIADLVAQAAGQYWDAIRARDNIKVLEQTWELAQKSYDRDKQALDLGALASLDIYQSETQLAERKRDLVQAQFLYQQSLDALRRLIGADLDPKFREMEIVLEDDPGKLPEKHAILPFNEALAEANRLRPELDAAHRRVTIDDLNARVAKNLLTPQVNLTIQASSNSLAGNQVGVVGPLGITTPAVSGGLGDTLGQMFAFNYPAYGAGIQITLPIRGSAARAQLADALVNRTRDRYNERAVEQQVIQDVKQALNSINLANATIETAIRARDLARKNVQAEQQKYELGTITAFEMLDSQTQLASSESALLNAYIGYQQAWISYERATWTLLDGLGMVIEAPKVS